MFDKIQSLFKKPNKAKSAFELAYNELRPPSKHGSFCYAPMNNLYFSWEGKAIACCFNQDYILGNYPKQSIKEIWNGTKAKELRKAMDEFDLSKGCDICFNDVQNKQYDAVNALRFDDFVPEEFPVMMEFQLSNTCNLQCVMCNGHLSSSIRKHRDKLPPLPQKYDAAFVDQLEEFIPHLKYTTFSGGEPFLIDIYYDIWDKMIELNPNCIIKVITNGTVYNSRVENLLKKGNFHITISLDSPRKANYEQIRVGANFDRVIANSRKMNAICKENGTNFNFNFCPMASNWEEIPEFLQLANDLDASIYYSIVYFPLKHSIQSLDKATLSHIASVLNKEVEAFPQNTNRTLTKLLINKIEKWQNEETVSPNQSEFQTQEEFVEFVIAKIDKHYSNNQLNTPSFVREKITQIFSGIDAKAIYTDNFLASLDDLPSVPKFEQSLSLPVEELAIDILNRFSKK